MFNWWTSSQVWWFPYKKSNKLQWVYNHSMVTISNRLEISHGCSRKKAGGWGHTFLKRPGIFHFFPLSLEIPVKNKAPPRQILQDCVTSLGNSMAKNHQAPPPPPLQIANPTLLFLVHPWEFCLLFLWYPWRLHIIIFPWSLKSHFNLKYCPWLN